MKGLRFSLLQLIICIGLILVIAFIVLNNFQPQPTSNEAAPETQINLPIQEIKVR